MTKKMRLTKTITTPNYEYTLVKGRCRKFKDAFGKVVKFPKPCFMNEKGFALKAVRRIQ